MTDKKMFQESIKASKTLQPLFSGSLEAKIKSLQAQAQAAEDAFWTAARAEFSAAGVVSRAPIDAADRVCLGAGVTVNQILTIFDTMLNWLSPEEDTIPWTTGTSKRTLYAPFVKDACAAMLTKIADIKSVVESAQNYDAYNNIFGGFRDIYDTVLATLSQFGPNFPTPLTSFYSSNVHYHRPAISASFATGTPIVLYLSNVYDSVNGLDGGIFATPASDGGSFHVLATGDTVYIARLEVPATLLSRLVGSRLLVTNVSNGLSLKHPNDANLNHELTNAVQSNAATTFGEVFELRKIRGNES
jgi:hypothetical protein